MIITAGTTSLMWPVFIRSTAGGGKTGLVYNSSGMTAYYRREGQASATAIALVTATVGTFTSSGFKEVDATNQPGHYEIGLPNAAIAAGAKWVDLCLKGASGMVQYSERIQLSAFDLQTASPVVASVTGAVGSVTGNVGGNVVGSVASVAATVNADAIKVNGSASAAAKLALAAVGIVSGAAIAGTLSTTQMTTDLTEATNDHYVDATIVWTSGALAGQRKAITSYNGTSKVLTYDAATDAPSAADTFVIV